MLRRSGTAEPYPFVSIEVFEEMGQGDLGSGRHWQQGGD
jgi:hypothetical protein